jgi:Ca2+-transporting ATPase
MEIETKDIITMFERSDTSILERGGGIEGFATMFQTDLNNGLSKGEAATEYKERIEQYGENKLPDPPVKTWCRMFIETFDDITLKILAIAVVVSTVLATAFHWDDLTFAEYIDPISILIALLLVSITTAQTNYSQQQAYLEINSLKNTYAVTVIRAGERQQIKSTEVLVGDILEVKAGDAVAADAIFINGTNLSINNSAQTGEPIAVKINSSSPFLRGGGAIESGIGTCLVSAVGPNSQYGVTMTQITNMQAEEEPTPLQKKLDSLGKTLLYIAIFATALTFIVVMTTWFIDLHKELQKDHVNNKIYTDLMDKVMTVIIIFLCCVPEGLPLAVTLSLSFSMKQMMYDQNFVRHLNACETMGGATTICSDKTGTLTQNKMTVVKFYMDGKEQDQHPELSEDIKDLVSRAISINSTASHTIKEGTEETIFVGSSSECALLMFVSDLGRDYQEIRELNPTLYLNEFSSARKKMSTVVRSETGCTVYLKGAPDFCLPLCSHYITPEGEVKEADDEFRNRLLQKVNDFACQAYRTMLVAYKEVEGETDPQWEDPKFAEDKLTFICMVGIQDPLRPEVPAAIEACESAGVVVRMVTGDFIATARAISQGCGILKNDTDIVMEGKEFASMSKVELLDKIDNLRVLARSSPTDKYRLVTLLMECGEVVAVTGDGSNDSAALKKANVGFSMGICGTELAKVASDIVILDDNFKSIVSALKWGRGIYDNIRCFLTFQIPVNMVAVACSVIGSAVFDSSPLKPIQILWMNLINDSLGALALATRPPTENLLKRPPYGDSDGLVSNVVFRNIVVQSVYQIIVEFLIMFGHDSIFGVEDNSEDNYNTHSWMFNAFVYMNVFNLINARKASNDGSIFEGFFANPYYIIILIGLAIIQIPLIMFGGRVFYANKPSGKEWLITMAFSVGDVIVGFLTNLWNMEDHTKDNLDAYRAMRKEKVRQYYSRMSTEEQWDDKNLMKEDSAIPVQVEVENVGEI